MAGASGPLTGSSVTIHMATGSGNDSLATGAARNTWSSYVGTGKLVPLAAAAFNEAGIATATNRVKHVTGELSLTVEGDPISIRPYGESSISIPRLGDAPTVDMEIAFDGSNALHKSLRDAALGTKFLLGRLTFEASDKATLEVAEVRTSGKPKPAGPSDDVQNLTVSLALATEVLSIDQA